MGVEIRKGTMEDVEGFLALLQEVREHMDHKEWLYLDPPEIVRQQMSDGTMQLWIAVDGERIVAAFDLLIPGLAEYNYGYDLGFSEEQLQRVINMDTAVVHPAYRGMGLQRQLLQTAEATLNGAGERCLLCTVHPDNRFSLNNAVKQGYVIQKELAKYDSVRYLLRKDIF